MQQLAISPRTERAPGSDPFGPLCAMFPPRIGFLNRLAGLSEGSNLLIGVKVRANGCLSPCPAMTWRPAQCVPLVECHQGSAPSPPLEMIEIARGQGRF